MPNQASYQRTYYVTTYQDLGTIPVIKGNVIALTDTEGFYYDVEDPSTHNPVRRCASGIKYIDSLEERGHEKNVIYIYLTGDAGSRQASGYCWNSDLDDWDTLFENANTEYNSVLSIEKVAKSYIVATETAGTTTGTLIKNPNIYLTANGKIHANIEGNADTATSATSATSATTANKAINDNAASPKPITGYLHDVSSNATTNLGSTLTFTDGAGNTTSVRVSDTTYSNFTTSAPGLVPAASGGTAADLILMGNGWQDKANIAIGTADTADEAVKDASGNTITSTYFASASFSGGDLTLTKGDGTTSTTLTIPDTTYSVFDQGVAGLVPAPTAADSGKFLKGDHTWASVPVPNYSGATGSSGGTAGLVPPAASGQTAYFLRGDATWGTTFAQGSVGLVPAPTSADSGKFLKGDGTWASPAAAAQNTVGSNDTSSKLFIVGAQSQTTGSSGVQSYSNSNVYTQSGKLYSNGVEVVNLSDSQALTNKSYEGYTLGTACEADLTATLTNSSPSDDVPTNDAVRTYVQSVKSTIQNDLEYKADNNIIASAFDNTATYEVGEFCIYDDGNGAKLYQCTTAISTAGAWDSTKWTVHIVSDYFSGNYAEAEHIVGNWIDGSVLYEQTITLSSITASTAQTVAHGITADKIFIHEGITEYTISSTDYHGVISAYDTTAGTDELCVRISDTDIEYLAGTNLASATAYIKVRYTKPAS